VSCFAHYLRSLALAVN